jgi:hypothetical protein
MCQNQASASTRPAPRNSDLQGKAPARTEAAALPRPNLTDVLPDPIEFLPINVVGFHHKFGSLTGKDII